MSAENAIGRNVKSTVIFEFVKNGFLCTNSNFAQIFRKNSTGNFLLYQLTTTVQLHIIQFSHGIGII